MISHAKTRITILELMQNLHRIGEAHYFPGYSARVRRQQAEIFAAIVIAHAKRRASTASGIARNLGLPRATVERRMALLLQDGLIERKKNGYCVNEAKVNGPSSEQLAKKARQMVLKAAKFLADLE